MFTRGHTEISFKKMVTLEELIHLEYSNPVFGMWPDELSQGVVTFQCCMRKVTLPHVLEDDVGKV